jgi:hypothetical protein
MEQHLNHVYKKQYLRGYAFGMNPAFHECEDPRRIVPAVHDDAFLTGFQKGRDNYERWNGLLCDGIPDLVINDKVLSRYFTDGALGYPFEVSGYTVYQQHVIFQSYQAGMAEYDLRRDVMLSSFLQSIHIDH